LDAAHILVAEFRESIKPAVLQIVAFLGDRDFTVRDAGAEALSKLSKQGEKSKFLT
jgi:HEAT repeat protein